MGVTTTPLPTCEGFTCPHGQELIGDDVVCATGHCCAKTCCKTIITTVTTTPLPTCEDFMCPTGFKTLKDVVCATGKCTQEVCCHKLPPPCTTVTTTPLPTCAG